MWCVWCAYECWFSMQCSDTNGNDKSAGWQTQMLCVLLCNDFITFQTDVPLRGTSCGCRSRPGTPILWNGPALTLLDLIGEARHIHRDVLRHDLHEWWRQRLSSVIPIHLQASLLQSRDQQRLVIDQRGQSGEAHLQLPVEGRQP